MVGGLAAVGGGGGAGGVERVDGGCRGRRRRRGADLLLVSNDQDGRDHCCRYDCCCGHEKNTHSCPVCHAGDAGLVYALEKEKVQCVEKF